MDLQTTVQANEVRADFSKHGMNEENAMHMPGSNNHRQQSVAGQGRRQLQCRVEKRNDHEYAVKKVFISGAMALLVLTYPAHASAQQVASPDKAGQSQQAAEASFMAENQAAMSKMMMNMAVKPTGNVDADFTAMMIAHHQGAIDMAETELRYGHNKKLLRIAKSIIAKQRQQIGAMKAALGQPPPPATSSATQSGHASRDDARSAHNGTRSN
jgi:hypothetical protein